MAIVTDAAKDAWDGVTGKTQADAATEAAKIQSDAAKNAALLQSQSSADQIAFQKESLANQQDLMQPYNEFGQGFMDQTTQASDNLGQLYNDPMSIMNNPMFNAIQEDVRRQNLQNAAVGGRLGTGGTMAGLESAALLTGFDILNNERTSQTNYMNSMANLVGMGQNAAVNMGSGILNTGTDVSNTMQNSTQNQNQWNTDAASSTSAGVIGKANAETQGINNVIGLGTAAFTGGFGMPSMGGVGDMFSKLGMPTVGTALNPTQTMTRPGQTYGR